MSISDDQAYLLRHTTLKGIQSVALIAVPASLLHAVRTTSQPRPIVFLRTLGLSTFVLGSAGGLALGWFKSGAYTLGHGNPVGVEGRDGLVLEGIRERAARLRVSRSQIKTDDYSVVGALVGSLATTTVFLRRTPILYNVTGGAALGLAMGVLMAWRENLSEPSLIGKG